MPRRRVLATSSRARRIASCGAAFGLAIAVGLAQADSLADALGAYQATTGNKALATAQEGDRFVYGIGAGQASNTANSMDAIRQCAGARAERSIVTRCEISRLNDAPVTTAHEIRARIGDDPHPLFLWRFESKTATVYLAGSIHVLKPTLYPLPVQFSRAFEQSEKLVVEVDTITIDPTVLQSTTAQYAFLPQGQNIDSVVSSDTREALHAYLAGEGIPRVSVARLKPAILATQLAVAQLMALGYLPDSGLEQYFAQRANGRPILELETLEQQLDLLTNAPMRVQEEMLAETLAQMDIIEPLIADMVVAWFKGDDDLFLDLYHAQSPASEAFRAFLKRLLDDRNVAMAEKVAGYLASTGTYFVLVGSAHLAGPEGIVQQLARREIVGQQIQSDGDI